MGNPDNMKNQLNKMEDFKNAISFLSSLQNIDSERIGVCGTSMGGGYMLQLAALMEE